jgi:selenoprotein W-related protein
MEITMRKVTIIYCRPCGYEKRAREVAKALHDQLSLDATLVPGNGGAFEIKVGDKTVAKRAKGYFPGPAEVVAAVAACR